MYVRVTMIRLMPDIPISSVVQTVKKAEEVYKSLPGFKSIIFLADDVTKECGSISFWETEEDAIHAGNSLSSEVYSEFSNHIVEARPVVAIYEVFNPNSVPYSYLM